jgi:predicted permease
VAGQIALALVLLANAGVLFRSFARLSSEQPGFDSTNVFTARVSFPQVGYPDRAAIVRFYEKIQSRLTQTPGAKNVALVSILPLAPKSIAFIPVRRPDTAPAKPQDQPSTNYRIVSPNYFRAMGIPLLSGRYFTEADDDDQPLVAIVSSVLAKNHFPDRSAIGQRLLIDDIDGDPRPVEIVGIVGPVKQTNLETPPRSDIYLPLRQMPEDAVPWQRTSSYWVMKLSPQSPKLEPVLREAVRSVDGDVAVGAVRPMTEIVAAALAARRFSLLLIGSFAGTAIFLSAAGLYAVIAYGIQQRTREIGVRLALGATRAAILRMIFREGGILLLAGMAVGLAVALGMAKLIAGQIYGVSERDPLSFGVVSLILAGISLLGCGIAARRATKVDPIQALRAE